LQILQVTKILTKNSREKLENQIMRNRLKKKQKIKEKASKANKEKKPPKEKSISKKKTEKTKSPDSLENAENLEEKNYQISKKSSSSSSPSSSPSNSDVEQSLSSLSGDEEENEEERMKPSIEFKRWEDMYNDKNKSRKKVAKEPKVKPEKRESKKTSISVDEYKNSIEYLDPSAKFFEPNKLKINEKNEDEYYMKIAQKELNDEKQMKKNLLEKEGQENTLECSRSRPFAPLSQGEKSRIFVEKRKNMFTDSSDRNVILFPLESDIPKTTHSARAVRQDQRATTKEMSFLNLSSLNARKKTTFFCNKQNSSMGIVYYGIY